MLNFAGRPPAKPAPQRVIGASEFLLLAANRAYGVQAVIAAVELMELELEPPSIVRTSDNAVQPELLYYLMRLFC